MARLGLTLVLLCAAICTVKCAHSALSVVIDETIGGDGAFSVTVDGVEYFASGGVSVRDDGVGYSTEDGTLKLGGVMHSEGKDALGEFNETSITYTAYDPSTGDDAGFSFAGNIRLYDTSIFFEQFWISGAKNCAVGDADGVISSFPTFKVSDAHPLSGQCQWTSWDYDAHDGNADDEQAPGLVAPGFLSPSCREWNSSVVVPHGLAGTGPMVVFDEGATTSFVLSPMSHVMASNIVAKEGSVGFGVMGNVTSLETNYAQKTILYMGSKGGINDVVSEWGAAIRGWNNKPDASSARRSDITLQYLGYSTDNGAYYYYNTEEGKDYGSTLVDIKKYADQVGLPYKWVLLDSWWYLKGSHDGVSEWTPQPDIFPDGLDALYEATGWLVQAHNRWWDSETVYAKQNGGDYDFIIDSEGRNGAMPTEQRFFDDLMADKASWGLRVYEQDWLYNEFMQKVGAVLESATLARTWLMQMGEGARKAGLTIQYCMPFARHLLQSLEIPVVTQARASDDYQPANDNWAIGGQNILMDALGLAPSKDCFWSTVNQPGNPYTYADNVTEPYPELQAAAITLSAGPVAVADGIGYSNVELIMRSCRDDGLLLQPSAPMKLVDAALMYRATPHAGVSGPAGEVYVAHTILPGRDYGYLLSASLTNEWSFTPQDIGYAPGMSFAVVDVRAKEFVGLLSDDQPMTLHVSGKDDFQLLSLSPVESNGWALVGEVNKWVGVSTARYLEVTTTPESMLVEVTGVKGENVTIGFVSPEGELVRHSCIVPEESVMKLSTQGDCF